MAEGIDMVVDILMFFVLFGGISWWHYRRKRWYANYLAKRDKECEELAPYSRIRYVKRAVSGRLIPVRYDIAHVDAIPWDDLRTCASDPPDEYLPDVVDIKGNLVARDDRLCSGGF